MPGGVVSEGLPFRFPSRNPAARSATPRFRKTFDTVPGEAPVAVATSRQVPPASYSRTIWS